MKHSRMTAGSFAGVLSPLAGIAALLAGTLPAQGGEVPFTEHVISMKQLMFVGELHTPTF